MGATESAESKTFYDTTKKIPYTGFKEFPDGTATILHNVFMSKFSSSFSDVAQVLWNAYASGAEMLLHEYERIIDDLYYERQKLRYFVGLLSFDALKKEDIKRVLNWCSFQSLNPEFIDTLIESYMTYVGKDESLMLKDHFVSWANRNMPDLAEDLAKLVSYCLNKDHTVSPSYQISEISSSNVINQDIIWLLSSGLSLPYKKRNDTILHDSTPLEMEQFSHLKCLFNSVKDGASCSTLRETCFDYEGPILLFVKCGNMLLCVASDEGIKESWDTFGGVDSKLLQILPKFSKLVSGSTKPMDGSQYGIIYSQFTAKTAKRGFLVGHRPLSNPVIEIDEGFSTLRLTGGPPLKIDLIEVWAAGAAMHLAKLQELREWKGKEVQKEKNRKLKLDEDWKNNPDRMLLDLGGVKTTHAADLLEPEPPVLENPVTKEPV